MNRIYRIFFNPLHPPDLSNPRSNFDYRSFFSTSENSPAKQTKRF
jgi:hypothetical protein